MHLWIIRLYAPIHLIRLILITLSSFFFSLVILSSSAHLLICSFPHPPHVPPHSPTPLSLLSPLRHSVDILFFCLCCRDSHSIVPHTCYWSHTVCIRYYVIIMYFSLNSLRECSLCMCIVVAKWWNQGTLHWLMRFERLLDGDLEVSLKGRSVTYAWVGFWWLRIQLSDHNVVRPVPLVSTTAFLPWVREGNCRSK